ncbi:hypothetical protein BCR34DRAFT_554745 [Clohesyomyces aquaticus]|uniref:Myb-like domain-containing protein n=1 Tax=Clohesyomyces aquaticus TaxID=1231657 RepID=A0A1Y2A5F1_9PLEO|nr:hypothetical protein BCR34DRAFT_554745 [Clohesyomyces aquaticus]
MAERRSVRSSSRRITPTPQPPSVAATPQPGRASRTRASRSASRDLESIAGSTTNTSRRSKRQASVASESENERPSRQTKRKDQQEPVGDLATVEEVDTQITIEEGAATPPRPAIVAIAPHRSPGAVSEMSGTTAMTSFSMVEAEDLKQQAILRRITRIHDSARELLEHLVPDQGRIEDDSEHYFELQKPDSEYTSTFRDLDFDFSNDLTFFKTEHQDYIRPRAVHRALLGPDRDPTAMRSGLDLVIFLANICFFSKFMMTSDRDKESMWTALLALDNTFPSIFLHSLNVEHSDFSRGESALVRETFELALELRTQLALLVLYRSSNGSNEALSDPDSQLSEVFFRSPEDGAESVVRGWEVIGLGGRGSHLDKNLSNLVVKRINEIRKHLPKDTETLERGETVDFDNLFAAFPWSSCILQLQDWVRSRKRELYASIDGLGGIRAISEQVRVEVQQPEIRAASVPKASPRKKRTSFGGDRRRSSQKFDPNAPLDEGVIAKLLAREKAVATKPQAKSLDKTQQPTKDVQEAAPQPQEEQDQWQPLPLDDEEFPEPANPGPSNSAPPRSTAEYVKKYKEVKKIDKENRRGFIARQPTAERVEFGDGFEDTQPVVASSSKGKQPQDPSPRKRRRPTHEDELDDDDDEDEFETAQRDARAEVRRQKAPVKKARFFDIPSSAPPSHQLPTRNTNEESVSRPRPQSQPQLQDESFSEEDAPDMTEENPPRSSYAAIRNMARVNSSTIARPRKGKVPWSLQEEEALLEYMENFPRQYALIVKLDSSDEGHGVLGARSQVNIKDKVRNMAINMIKSGTGLQPGFENVITAESKIGAQLIEDGYEWQN